MVHSGIPWSGDLPSRFKKDNSDRNFERALLFENHNIAQSEPDFAWFSASIEASVNNNNKTKLGNV